ncbi:fusion protein [Neurachne minor latent virus]|nr:fusion protein [Neurachne minor latent virus]
MPVDPLRTIEETDELATEESNRIADLMNVFNESALTRAQCTRNDIIACHQTVDELDKCIRAVKSYVEQRTFDDLWTQAHNAGSVASAQVLTFRDLFRFKKFITSPAGQNVVRNVQAKKKLQRAGRTKHEADQVALTRLFTTQYEVRARGVTKDNGELDIKAAKIRARLEKINRKKEENIQKWDDRCPVVAGYQELTIAQVREEAWKMYLQQCAAEHRDPPPKSTRNLEAVAEKFGAEVKEDHLVQYCTNERVRAALISFGEEHIKNLEKEGTRRNVETFVTSWSSQTKVKFLRYPLPERRRLMTRIPVGKIPPTLSMLRTRRLADVMRSSLLRRKATAGRRLKPLVPRGLESVGDPLPLLAGNGRLKLLGRRGRVRNNAIQMTKSHWEAGVRHIIGGGELINWRADNNKYRGGGCLYDALLLLANADDVTPFQELGDHFQLREARDILKLPCGLKVPDGRGACTMKHYNDDATAGPLLRAFGIKGKYGLKTVVEDFVWEVYDMAGNGLLGIDQLPALLARVGYRSKLHDRPAAMKKISELKPLGRAVMMLDATEQAFSSPIFNVISDIVTKLHDDKSSGWRNYLVRASSGWIDLWDEVRDSQVIVELDWSKFDRERPRQDIQFFIDIICSCFSPSSLREELLLAAYKKMMENALVNRVMLLDNGSIVTMDGMVPSGSLWTGICDTALNILYINAALIKLGFGRNSFNPKCAGDDNITLFTRRYSTLELTRLRDALNEMFRAGIEEDEFIIHYPPFFVSREQAQFPPNVDIEKGTSKIIDQAKWIPLTDELIVDRFRGLSHRWRYNFHAKPKFLANFFLPDGRPIRPAADSLERLLWPEGVHKSLDDYIMAVLAMIVDNPFNHHNVNHMMVRYIIAHQLREQAYDVDEKLVMDLCAIRPKNDEAVPYPGVAFWRRGSSTTRFEDEPAFRHLFDELQKFISSVSTLYTRKTSGGIDSWRFMEILRGEHSIGAGQFGNDIREWCKFLGKNPLTKSLKAARRFRVQEKNPVADDDTINKAKEAFAWCLNFSKETSFVGPVHYASEVSKLLLERAG